MTPRKAIEGMWQEVKGLPADDAANLLYFLCGYLKDNKQFAEGLACGLSDIRSVVTRTTKRIGG